MREALGPRRLPTRGGSERRRARRLCPGGGGIRY